MIDLKYEVSFLRASMDELETYLLAKELFWSVSPPAGIRSFQMLTLGSLMLAIKKLKASPNREIRVEHTQLAQEVERIHNKWTAAWENKAKREFTSRLRQWNHYLNDLQKNEETHAPYYPNEVRVRVLIALLVEHAPDNELKALSQFDEVLQAKLNSSDFIWDPELQPEFPPAEFWFLYGII